MHSDIETEVGQTGQNSSRACRFELKFESISCLWSEIESNWFKMSERVELALLTRP